MASGTKHVDVRTKYVNQYCEDGIVKIISLELANDDTDIFTKLFNQDFHNKHSDKLISTKTSCLRYKFNMGRIWVRPQHNRVRSTVMRNVELGYKY